MKAALGNLKNPFDVIDGFIKRHNPFKELTPKEIQSQEKEEKEIKEEVSRLGRICNDILIDQRYKEFADLFKEIEKKVIHTMIYCDEPDRDAYYLKMKSYQEKLKIYRTILQVPHGFVQRAEEVEKVNRTFAE